ncbi:MAG: RNA-binding protein [Moraxellaceae bacterium]|nr:MAG: RNA-binding protein [Moraxellaceae bacterium]
MSKKSAPKQALSSVRIDKWLWAARFYKTRSLAKQAVESGKVHYQGNRVKASKEIGLDSIIAVRRGEEERTIQVIALSEKRGPAKVAQTLYQETEQSLLARTSISALKQAQRISDPSPDNKPTKKDRRKIMQLNKME